MQTARVSFRLALASVALLATLAGPGCAPIAVRHTTEPVAPGKFQVGGGADGLLFRDGSQKTSLPAAMVTLDGRYGVSENFDVGVRLFTLGGGVNAKWRLLNGKIPIAVVPGISFGRTPESSIFSRALHLYGDLPVIFGTAISASTTLNLGPRLLYDHYWPWYGGRAFGLLLGGFTNVDVKVATGWHFIPELSVSGTLAGDVPVRGFVAAFGMGVAKDL